MKKEKRLSGTVKNVFTAGDSRRKRLADDPVLPSRIPQSDKWRPDPFPGKVSLVRALVIAAFAASIPAMPAYAFTLQTATETSTETETSSIDIGSLETITVARDSNIVMSLNDDTNTINLYLNDAISATSASIGGISISSSGVSGLSTGTTEIAADNTSAVSGGALYSYLTSNYTATDDAGWTVKVGNAEYKVGEGGNLTFASGDDNLAVELTTADDASTVTLTLASDPSFTSVTSDTFTAGNSSLTSSGLTVTGTASEDGTAAAQAILSSAGLTVTNGTNSSSVTSSGISTTGSVTAGTSLLVGASGSQSELTSTGLTFSNGTAITPLSNHNLIIGSGNEITMTTGTGNGSIVIGDENTGSSSTGQNIVIGYEQTLKDGVKRAVSINPVNSSPGVASVSVGVQASGAN